MAETTYTRETLPEQLRCGACRDLGGEHIVSGDCRFADAFCAECGSLMVNDAGAGHLCPACDQHPISDCGSDFPCSGEDLHLRDGSHRPCVLNRPIVEARPGVTR